MLESSEVRLTWGDRTATTPPAGATLRPDPHSSARSLLVAGDNALALTALAPRYRRRVALAYLDPPFFTGRIHHRVIRRRGSDGGMLRELSPAFDDRWEGLGDYLDALSVRVRLARELLSDDGCLVLHVDPKTSHYARVLLDEIFGPSCFASEIIWRYRRWPSKTPNFQRVHDVLLRYVKSPDTKPRFTQLYEPLAASTQATWGDRRQRAVFDGKGRRQRSSTTPDPSPGAPLGDVWELGIVAPVSRERTGYPTQKPEALLSRLIEACTHPDDWVLDPYAGSGTSLSVSAKLKRRAIGIDCSSEALSVIRRRLAEGGVAFHEASVVMGLGSKRAARSAA